MCVLKNDAALHTKTFFVWHIVSLTGIMSALFTLVASAKRSGMMEL